MKKPGSISQLFEEFRRIRTRRGKLAVSGVSSCKCDRIEGIVPVMLAREDCRRCCSQTKVFEGLDG